MRCSKCGSEIKEGSAFCFNCGNVVLDVKKGEIKDGMAADDLQHCEAELRERIIALTESLSRFEYSEKAVWGHEGLLEQLKSFSESLNSFSKVIHGKHFQISSATRKALGEYKSLIEKILKCIYKCESENENKERNCVYDIKTTSFGNDKKHLLYNLVETEIAHEIRSIEAMEEDIPVQAAHRESQPVMPLSYSQMPAMCSEMSLPQKTKKTSAVSKRTQKDQASERNSVGVDFGNGYSIGVKGAYGGWSKSADEDEGEYKPETFSIPDMPFDDEEISEFFYENKEDGWKEESQGTEPIKVSDVQFSAVSRRKIEKSEYIPVDIIMYEEEFRNMVEIRVSGENSETRSGYHSVASQSKVRVVLSSLDIEIDDCEEERIWQGKYLEFGFFVFVPETYEKKQVLICASIYINGLIATKLKFVVGVEGAEEKKIKTEREDITTAFVSYSSKDRDRVASIVQGMEKARPDMDIFFDVESLRSGQEWEAALKTEIDRSNIFFLCWSKSASKSKWVDFEWRYAFTKKGSEGIEPIPIEPPELCPPPEELNQKHFNDKIVYMVKALELMKRKAACIKIKQFGFSRKIPVTGEGFTIGKARECDYRIIMSPGVEEFHAEIININGEFYITNLAIKYKMYVDGKVCEKGQSVPLKHGSVIKISGVKMIFELFE